MCSRSLHIVIIRINNHAYKRGIMTKPVRISDEFYESAKVEAPLQTRSIAQQIEYWGKIGRLADANPHLPLQVIRDSMTGLAQWEAGANLEEYHMGKGSH